METVDRWLSVEQVQEVVGLKRSALYRLWAQGRGPRYSRIGARRLVKEEWLEDWFCANEVVGQGEGGAGGGPSGGGVGRQPTARKARRGRSA